MMTNSQTNKRQRQRQEAAAPPATGDIGSGRSTSQQQQQHDDHHDDDKKEDDDKNISTRDVTQLYCSAATLHCARKRRCIPCAYKIACFDVARDTAFCQAIPNQRPETCPRIIAASLSSSSGAPNNKNIPAAVERRTGVITKMGMPLGYQPHYRILTIGDGDFSFSLALAFMLQQQQHSTGNNGARSGGSLTATSFESKETLKNVYGHDMMSTRIQLLESMGVRILYQVDGTKLTPELFFTQQQQQNQQQDSSQSSPLSSSSSCLFHRIVWNFPCSAIQKGQDGQNQEMDFNKALIRDFVAGAVPLLDDDNGQIHINHKTKPPFNQWQIQDVALAALSSSKRGDKDNDDKPQQQLQQRNVYYWGRVVLDRALFPGYIPRKALHSKSFPVHDACTYIFGHCSSSSSSSNNNNNRNTNNAAASRGLDANVDDDANSDEMTASAATLVPVTRPLILSLRRHLLQSIIPSRMSNSKRNNKKRRIS